MTPDAILTTAEAVLRGGLASTDVLVGEVPTTPTRPYVVLTAQMPSVARRTVSGHAHGDRQVLMAMSVSTDAIAALMLAGRVRDLLDLRPVPGGGRLRYDFASAPITDDHPGDFRVSVTADYTVHYPRRHRA